MDFAKLVAVTNIAYESNWDQFIKLEYHVFSDLRSSRSPNQSTTKSIVDISMF